MASTRNKWLSRKFLMAVVGAACLIAKEGFGWEFDSPAVLSFAGIIISFIVGEAIVDAVNK